MLINRYYIIVILDQSCIIFHLFEFIL